MMTRDEHLAWAKTRALEYVDAGDLPNAATSLMSDLRKHPDLENHAGIELMAMHLFVGLLNTEPEMRTFIEGFA